MGWVERVRTLLDAPSPATLTTYGEGGSALVHPVWFRFEDGAFEVVIAEGDAKLRNLERDPRCSLLVFETVPPFRGVEASAPPELVRGDATEARASISGRYLGSPSLGRRYAEERKKPGVLFRLLDERPRVWDLSAILPTDA